jgi:hypothetical protein
MGRVDLISLTFLAASISLLTGMALAIPGEPIELASICRSRVDGVAPKAKAVSVAPVAARLKTRLDS